jgi:hypothetical protein
MILNRKLISHICVYFFGIFTTIAVPIIKWSVIAPIFGRQVDIKKSIDGLALKDGVVLEPSTKVPIQPYSTLPNIVISQEYPCSQGYNYRQSINLITHPAVITYQDDWQALWLGMGNADGKIKNFKNPSLFLNFNGNTQIKVNEKSSKGWVETDPNFMYFYKAEGSMQPGQGFRLNPLFIRFPKEGIYKVSYSITADNELPISGEFSIKVVK